MFKNYFKIAIRNLGKHKGYSFINIAGLAIGIACCIFILLYVKNELNYDRFNENADRIFRINTDFIEQGKSQRFEVTSAPIGPALKQDYPEIIDQVRISKRDKILIKSGDKSFYEDEFFFADPSFFKIFSFNLIHGSKSTALVDINSIVLDKNSAIKYFGNENPVGKILSVELRRELKDFKVTGVMDELHEPSHITPHFIIPFKNIGEASLNGWWSFGYNTYLLLDKETTTGVLESKFPAFIDTYLPKLEWISDIPKLSLQPLTDIHLHSDFLTEEGDMSPMTSIYLFLVLAFFIISIASINFMNLSTARSQGRAKEVGVRKVVGAARLQLVKQFLSESFIMAFISLGAAILLVELLIPFFNNLTEKTLSIDYQTDIIALSGFLVIAVFVGLVSGIYPAFFLSKFNTVEVLKGKSAVKTGGAFLRKSLVIAQYAISVILILGTILVYSQLEFIKNKELGFDKENVIIIQDRSRSLIKSGESFKSDLLSIPGVINATYAFSFPSDEEWWSTRVILEGENPEDRSGFYTFQTDFDFFKTLKAEFSAGRDFDKSYSTDSSKFIINESAVKEFGWSSPAEAIGKRISWLGHGPENPKTGEIIGVTKNFNFKSLHENVEPAIFHIMEGYELIALRISPNSVKNVISKLEKIVKQYDNVHPFEFSFLDDNINRQYESTEQLGNIFTTFSILAIFIACLGLFGLVSFTTEQRTKEIGIRKVLGASIPGIIVLLTKEFTKWILIASLIAFPVAYYFMNKWLESFAYKVDIGAWMFLFSGLSILFISLLTIGFQAIKAASANPIKSLRYE
jgi:putative ABC transport system permease protein